MLKPFYNEETVEIEGEVFQLVLNFRSIDATESVALKSWAEILDEITGDSPRQGTIGRVLWGLLRENHPEITLDQTATLMFGETGVRVGLAVKRLLDAAFNGAEEKTKGENPLEPRGA